MLAALLGDDTALQPLRRVIVGKTEGNPFYMEETVQVLLDHGALMRNGTLKLIKPLDELRIPPTVQAILASRIDRSAPRREGPAADAGGGGQGVSAGIDQEGHGQAG
jgi:predicted ATPase